MGVGTLLFGRTPRPRLSVGALLFAAAFAAGHLGLFGPPPLPDESRVLSGTDWLSWVAIAGSALLAFEGLLGPARHALRLLVAAGMFALVLRAVLEYQWSGSDAALWLAVLAFALVAIFLSFTRLAAEHEGASVPFCLLLVATGLAITAGLSGSAKLAQLAGLVASAVGALWVVRLLRPSVVLGATELAPPLLTAFGVALCAHYYSELQALDAWLLASAAFTPWLADLPVFVRLSPRSAGLLRAAFAALPVAAAVTRAVLAFEPDPYAGYGGY